MANILDFTLTDSGKNALWNAQNTGTNLTVTHVQFGAKNRKILGTETSLYLPKQASKITSGNRITDTQIRIAATMLGGSSYDVAEIGVWSGVPEEKGSVLLAYYSVESNYIVRMVQGVDLVFSYDMAIDASLSQNVTVVVDKDQSLASKLVTDHVADPLAHPQYFHLKNNNIVEGENKFKGTTTFQGKLIGSLTGNADSATKLQTARKINGTSFNGTDDILIKANVSTYIGANTDLNSITEIGFYHCDADAHAVTMKNIPQANAFTMIVTAAAGVQQLFKPYNNPIYYCRNFYGGSWSAWERLDYATKLKVARNVAISGGASANADFDGTASINLNIGTQWSGNSATATKLETARKIGGVVFDGTQDIVLAGVNSTGNQDTSGNASTATKLKNTKSFITDLGSEKSSNFDGSQDSSHGVKGVLPIEHGGTNSSSAKDARRSLSVPYRVILNTATDFNTLIESGIYAVLASSSPNAPEANWGLLEVIGDNGESTSKRVIQRYTADNGDLSHYTRILVNNTWSAWVNSANKNSNITGNANTATKLQNARQINGISFDGTSDISIPANVSIPIGSGDLNDYKTHGHYFCAANVVAATIKNLPSAVVGNAFSLEVMRNAGVSQRLVHYDTGRTFIRKFYNSWNAWQEVAFVSGNTASATQLQTARKINNIAFDGTSDITVEDNTKLPLTGGSLSGSLTIPYDNVMFAVGNDQDIGLLKKLGSQGKFVFGKDRSFTIAMDTVSSVIDPSHTFEDKLKLFSNGDTSVTGTLIGATGVFSGGHIGINNKQSDTGFGLSLYNGITVNGDNTPAYGMFFGGTSKFGTHGAVTGDWATYLTMDGVATRGWVFKHSANGNVASINASGDATFRKLNSSSVTSTQFQSGSAFSFLNGGSAQRIMTGGVLASNSYDDLVSVPTNGIYSKGSIASSGDIKTSVWMYAQKYVGVNGGDAVFQGNLTGAAQSIASKGNRSANADGDIGSGGLELHSYYGATGMPNSYGNLLTIGNTGGSQLALGWAGSDRGVERLYYRSARDSTKQWSAWKTVAYTDDNVASATKLQTARTINGVTFDGTKDISINDPTPFSKHRNTPVNRGNGVRYKNDTGSTIFVTISFKVFSYQTMTAYVNNTSSGSDMVVGQAWSDVGKGGSTTSQVSFFVEADQEYFTLGNGSIVAWSEFRV